MNNDLVSVIMPSYNTAQYIAKTIRSVQAQTHQNWEILLVDDCSTDETDSVVAPFLADKRIRFFKNDKNSGAAVSRNRALREAKGKWIAFLDSDDLWHPQKLEKQIDFMQRNGYAFSYTQYEEMNEEGVPMGTVLSGPKRITKVGMYNFCWPGCLTVMYDRERVGCVQIADIRKNNDYAMWLKVCQKENCYLLKEVLARYRRGRSGSISTQGIGTLVKWHYRLFRQAEKQCAFAAGVNTLRNLVFGFYKRIVYKKQIGE